MNPKHPFYRFVSIAVMAVMLWNIAGWLGIGMIMHHAHTHGDETHCEIMFCSCTVEDGKKICTCHHHGLNGEASNHQEDNHMGDCHYTASHSNSTSSTPSLVVTAKYNAMHAPFEDPVIFPNEDFILSILDESIISGIKPDLLRPPRA